MLNLEHLELLIKTTRHHMKLLAGFMPDSIKAPLYMYKAKESTLSTDVNIFFDALCKAESGDHSVINTVAGDHYTVLKEPHIRSLANVVCAGISG